MFVTIAQGQKILAQGGLLCFPTETFYALGCVAKNSKAVAAIYALKGRSRTKPLPLAAASISQACANVYLADIPPKLLDFWPGPVTILTTLQAKLEKSLAPELINSLGQVALRVSSHKTVQALAATDLLTVSSANLSGQAPVQRAANLSKELLAALAQSNLPWGIVSALEEEAAYTLPSTLVRSSQAGLEILRAGAVSKAAFEEKGLKVV